jgi:hypothetical protein
MLYPIAAVVKIGECHQPLLGKIAPTPNGPAKLPRGFPNMHDGREPGRATNHGEAMLTSPVELGNARMTRCTGCARISPSTPRPCDWTLWSEKS